MLCLLLLRLPFPARLSLSLSLCVIKKRREKKGIGFVFRLCSERDSVQFVISFRLRGRVRQNEGKRRRRRRTNHRITNHLRLVSSRMRKLAEAAGARQLQPPIFFFLLSFSLSFFLLLLPWGGSDQVRQGFLVVFGYFLFPTVLKKKRPSARFLPPDDSAILLTLIWCFLRHRQIKFCLYRIDFQIINKLHEN